MEFVDGPDLGEYILHKGRLDAEETVAILIQAVQAFDHAHRQGVVHRDVKPSNFILARQDGQLVVKMTDLGLSRAITDEDFRVTRDGSTVGTVDYLSPEQSRDSSGADIRSDIYSLGCTAYHMLAGIRRSDEGGLGERVYKHLHSEPPDLRKINPEVSPALWTIINACSPGSCALPDAGRVAERSTALARTIGRSGTRLFLDKPPGAARNRPRLKAAWEDRRLRVRRGVGVKCFHSGPCTAAAASSSAPARCWPSATANTPAVSCSPVARSTPPICVIGSRGPD